MGRFTEIGLFTGPVKSAFPVESPFRFIQETFLVSLGNVRFVDLVVTLGAHREPVFGSAQQTTFAASGVMDVDGEDVLSVAPRLAERAGEHEVHPQPQILGGLLGTLFRDSAQRGAFHACVLLFQVQIKWMLAFVLPNFSAIT